LLQAMKLATVQCPLQLKIVGRTRKPWLKRNLRFIRKYKLDSAVEFTEACTQAEVALAIAAADIAVAPLTAADRNTVQGCSPIKLFEYASCAKAIIAADIPAVREIFTDRENALLYNPRKPTQLRDRILELAEDAELRSRLGASARAL